MSNDNNELISACKEGDLATVRKLISKGASVNAQDKNGLSALYLAASCGHLEVVKELIQQVDDVDSMSNDNTPLMIAAYGGHLAVVNLLIEAGADVNARGKYGLTVLMKPIFSNKPKVVQLLIEKGADINLVDDKGEKAIDKVSKTEIEILVILKQASGESVDLQQELNKISNFINLKVAELVALYDSNSEGFITYIKSSLPVRTVGEQLNSYGEFKMMIDAHSRFTVLRPQHARNLEMVWDGIGDWRG